MPVADRLSGSAAVHRDTKPYVRHHPVIGYEYIPDSSMSLCAPDGRTYGIDINADGLRSSRLYSPRRPAGVYRLLVFGDSFAAGQYVSNRHRFSEILERRTRGLEVLNFALEGTGTDQQLLLFEEAARRYDFDAVLLMPYLQNIRRNMVSWRPSFDAASGARILIGKPRFELAGGALTLRNVPVSRERMPIDAEDGRTVDDSELGRSRAARLKATASRWLESTGLKTALYAIAPHEPLPEYADERSPEWTLMRAIIERFIQTSDGRPVVLAPVFHASYVRYRMSRNYWRRFESLADGRAVHAIDLLPHFRRLADDASRCFMLPHDSHFSIGGHLVLAIALERELRGRGLLPR